MGFNENVFPIARNCKFIAKVRETDFIVAAPRRECTLTHCTRENIYFFSWPGCGNLRKTLVFQQTY